VNVWKERPKCDLCDNDRKLHYKSPLGKEKEEYCTCANKMPFYEVMEYTLYRFKRDTRSMGDLWYEYRAPINKRDYEESIQYSYTRQPELFYEPTWDFVNISSRQRDKVWFHEQTDCQAYCDWLNAKEADNDKG
jgi:hypothetical protein